MYKCHDKIICEYMDKKHKTIEMKEKIVNIKYGQVRENFITPMKPNTTINHATSEILQNILEENQQTENEDKDKDEIVDEDEVQIVEEDEIEDKDDIKVGEKVKDNQELLGDNESEVVEGWRLEHPQKNNPSEFESNTTDPITRSLPQIESKCPICNYPTGFHKLYHLATRHFKERLLATLPSVAPFKCPKCKRFNAKTRYKLWIHYLGKHNYWKKWVDEPDWQPPPKRPESEIILMLSSSPSSSSSSTETTFQCSFCKQILGNQTELTDHIDEFHSWFKCTKCCKSFSSKSKWEGKF